MRRTSEVEILTVHIFHGKEEAPIQFAQIVHAAYVRM